MVTRNCLVITLSFFRSVFAEAREMFNQFYCVKSIESGFESTLINFCNLVTLPADGFWMRKSHFRMIIFSFTFFFASLVEV